MSGYWSFSLEVHEADAEAIEAALFDAGCLGCEVRDAAALPMPGAPAPVNGRGRIIAYFSDQVEPQTIRLLIGESWPDVPLEYADVEPRDWSSEWRTHVRPNTVGRIWVGPPWMETPSALIRIAIEPKMAFGTGDHPSTALCLEAIQRYCAAFPKDSCLDLGTGSGVLAIAARKLDAHPVLAVDNDPVCVTAARENAMLNGTPDIAISATPIENLSGRFGLVVANILANTLVELGPFIAPRVGRQLSLAGILREHKEEVGAVYRRLGLFLRGEETMAEWVRLDFQRR